MSTTVSRRPERASVAWSTEVSALTVDVPAALATVSRSVLPETLISSTP
jgi:hypothetical protein